VKKRLLDAEEVARHYPVGPGWLYQRVRAGDIRHFKIGRHLVRVEPQAVEDWLEDKGQGEAK